jgi:hypothetical protein
MKDFLGKLSKGGDDEENHDTGDGFRDDACIDWRMLGSVA